MQPQKTPTQEIAMLGRKQLNGSNAERPWTRNEQARYTSQYTGEITSCKNSNMIDNSRKFPEDTNHELV